MCRENQRLFKIGQKYRAVHTSSAYVLLLPAQISRYKNAFVK